MRAAVHGGRWVISPPGHATPGGAPMAASADRRGGSRWGASPCRRDGCPCIRRLYRRHDRNPDAEVAPGHRWRSEGYISQHKLVNFAASSNPAPATTDSCVLARATRKGRLSRFGRRFAGKSDVLFEVSREAMEIAHGAKPTLGRICEHIASSKDSRFPPL